MPGSLLLDTNIVVQYLNNDLKTVECLDKVDALYLPSVALGELLYGAYHSGKREQNLSVIREFVTVTSVLSSTEITADFYGQIKAECCR